MIEELLAIPGYREFICSNCEHAWKEKTKDITAQSCAECAVCGEINYPLSYTMVKKGTH